MDEDISSVGNYTQTKAQFSGDTQELLAIMKKKSKGDLKKLMKLSDNLGNLNAKRYKGFETAISKQCGFIFQGPAFAKLDLNSLEPEAHEFLQKHLRILSGLYGILRPLDMIHPYRLEMGTKLKTERGSSLYDFWGTKLSEFLKKDLEKMNAKKKLIVNVASNEYFKAVDTSVFGENIEIVNMIFKEKKNGALKIISVYAKQARGLFVRWMAEKNIETKAELQNFNVAGYKFIQNLSDEKNFVFARSQPEKKKSAPKKKKKVAVSPKTKKKVGKKKSVPKSTGKRKRTTKASMKKSNKRRKTM